MKDDVKPQPERPARLSRSESRQATRMALLAAAAEVFAERGFHGASVEDIVSRAGFTRGAFYSNFIDKEDLFLAVIDDRFEQARASLTPIVVGAESMDALLQGLTAREAAGPGDHRWVLLLTEFRLHALRNPEIRSRLVPRERAVRGALADSIAHRFASAGIALPASIELMALIVQVLDDGVPLMEDLDPEGVPAGSFQEALGLLFEAATALALVKGSAASKTR